MSEAGDTAPRVSLQRTYLTKWNGTEWERNNNCSGFNIQKKERTNLRKTRERERKEFIIIISIYELLEREVMGKG